MAVRAAISVTDATSSFTTMMGYSPTGTGLVALSDPVSDQSTGQGADDFIGNFYFKSDVATVGTSGTLMFRFNFDKYQSNGFGGNLRVGVDANGDGAVDMFFGIKDSGGGGSQVVFQAPTVVSSTANTTPNNSALGNVITTGAGAGVATSATNYSYLDTGGSAIGTVTYNDSLLTFAVPFLTLQGALNTVANVVGSGNISITTATALRFVAFTATNTNTVTQDVLGLGAIKTNGTTTFSSAGFSDFYSADGVAHPLPEATTIAQTVVLMGLPGYLWARRRMRGRAGSASENTGN